MACGSGKLSTSEAEKDICQDYPVVVDIRVSENASAIPGSLEHAKFAALTEQLAMAGWFALERKVEGDQERFLCKRSPSTPPFVRVGAKGFSIPAAEADFVKALRLEPEQGASR
jgi:hypothetical protein